MRSLAESITGVGRERTIRPGVMIMPWVVCLVVAIAAHFLIPMVVDAYWANVLRRAGIFIIAAVSLNIVNGVTGQFSMGHAGFMAIGGYVAAAFTYYGSLYFHGAVNADAFFWQGNALMIAGVFAGAIVAAIAGYLVGLPSLRLRGDYLAIVTLGFGEIIRVLLELTRAQIDSADAVRNNPLGALIALNGPTGFYGVPGYATLFWIWLFVAATCLVAYRMKFASSGRAFLSIREDEIAARAMGIDLTKYKVRAFVFAAFFGGIAGALYAHTGANPSPSDAGFQRSFDIIIFVVLGGLGSISGAALAALLLSVLSEVLRGPQPVLDAWWIWLAAAVALGAVGWWLKVRKNGGWRVIAVAALAPVVLLGFAGLTMLVKKTLDINLADYRMILYSLLLILMMLLRPNGLLGVREIWELFGPERVDRRKRTIADKPAGGGA